MYNNGPHLDWWHSLGAAERTEMMQRYGIGATNKGIYLMYHQNQAAESGVKK